MWLLWLMRAARMEPMLYHIVMHVVEIFLPLYPIGWDSSNSKHVTFHRVERQ